MKRRRSKKRGGEKHNVSIKKKKNFNLYPTIHCIKEKIIIGLSFKPVKLKSSKYGEVKSKDGVNIKHWLPGICAFRSPDYEINFSKYAKGEKIYCPKCMSPVDFRLFPSSTVPQLEQYGYDKEDSVKKLSDS